MNILFSSLGSGRPVLLPLRGVVPLDLGECNLACLAHTALGVVQVTLEHIF